jgi:hypothetical protein
MAADGGAALESENSSVFVRGGIGNSLVGGDGGFISSGGVVKVGAGGAALQLSPTSVATTAQDVTPVAGLDGDGMLTTSAVSGSGTYTPVAESLATIDIQPHVATSGALITVALEGEPASVDVAFFGFDSASPLAIPGIFGLVLVDVGQLTQLQPLMLDATGQATHAFFAPTAPGLVGTSVLFQSLATSPSGVASFSAPGFVALY